MAKKKRTLKKLVLQINPYDLIEYVMRDRDRGELMDGIMANLVSGCKPITSYRSHRAVFDNVCSAIPLRLIMNLNEVGDRLHTSGDADYREVTEDDDNSFTVKWLK